MKPSRRSLIKNEYYTKIEKVKEKKVIKNFDDVIYANSIFMAVGGSETILTSTDGISWSSRTSETGNAVYGVTYKE